MPDTFGRIGWRQARQAPVIDRAADGELEAVSSPDLVAPFVYTIIGLYAFIFAALSILEHEGFQTNAFDLGNMDQAVWNTANGRPLEFTNWSGGTSRLAAHVEPILFLVALAYRVHSSALTLLVIQSFVIALGALPAFWLARDVLRNSFVAAVFSFSYLLSPALEAANLADFHAVAFSSAFLLFAFYFAHRRAYAGFFLAALLAMATKEQVPLSVFLMGLYIAFVQRARVPGITACVLAAAWAGIAFGVVIPHFNPEGVSPYLSRYDQLGKSPVEILQSLVLDPANTVRLLTDEPKVDYVQSLLSPTLYLSLLSPLTLVMAVPDLAINLLSNFPGMYAGRAHYGAVIVPFVTVSAVLGTALVRRLLAAVHPTVAGWGTAAIGTAVLVASLSGFFQQVFLPLSDHLPHVSDHDRLASSIIKLIPPDASVSASSALNPHVSQRRGLYLFPEYEKADHIFVDVTGSPFPLDTASQWWKIQQVLESGEWGVVAARDGYLLLRRGAPGRDLPEEFYSFAFARPLEPYQRLDVAFGDVLRLAGYRLEPGNVLHGNDPYATLTLFWKVERKPEQDFLIGVSVVREDGRPIYTDYYQPQLLWYPPSRWDGAQMIKAEVPWLPMGDARDAHVRVRLVTREAPHRTLPELRPEQQGALPGTGGDGDSVRIATLKRA